MIIIVIMFRIIAAIIAQDIASKKGYTRRVAFVAGFFLGYITVIHYAILPTTNKKVVQNTIAQEKIRREIEAIQKVQ